MPREGRRSSFQPSEPAIHRPRFAAHGHPVDPNPRLLHRVDGVDGLRSPPPRAQHTGRTHAGTRATCNMPCSTFQDPRSRHGSTCLALTRIQGRPAAATNDRLGSLVFKTLRLPEPEPTALSPPRDKISPRQVFSLGQRRYLPAGSISPRLHVFPPSPIRTARVSDCSLADNPEHEATPANPGKGQTPATEPRGQSRNQANGILTG